MCMLSLWVSANVIVFVLVSVFLQPPYCNVMCSEWRRWGDSASVPGRPHGTAAYQGSRCRRDDSTSDYQGVKDDVSDLHGPWWQCHHRGLCDDHAAAAAAAAAADDDDDDDNAGMLGLGLDAHGLFLDLATQGLGLELETQALLWDVWLSSTVFCKFSAEDNKRLRDGS